MAWTCKTCGRKEIADHEPCPVCAVVRRAVLALSAPASGKRRQVRVPAEIGKPTLTSLVGEDGRFASTPQFHLRFDEHRGWLLEHAATASNATWHNGKPLAEPVPLREGDAISIGGAGWAVLQVSLSYD